MRPRERNVARGEQGVNDSEAVAWQPEIRRSTAKVGRDLACPCPIIDHQLNAGAALPRIFAQTPSQMNRPALGI